MTGIILVNPRSSQTSGAVAVASGERIPQLIATTFAAILLALVVPRETVAQEARPQPPVPATQGTPAQASATPEPSKFRSEEDGWLDISGFLDTKYGFLPIAGPITEPAVGLGIAGALAFIDKPLGRDRPNITVGGAFGTENGTKGALAGDLRYWLDKRLQTLAGVIFASVNLDFYGVGDESLLTDNPLRYNLEPAGGIAEAKYRIGSSAVWVGAGYVYSSTGVRFDAPEGTPGRPDTARSSHVGGLTPSVTYDTRDNLFTPTRGTYVEGKIGFFNDALGSDDDFERVRVIGMQFVPLPAMLHLGIRGEVGSIHGDAPFYLRPFINQRGVPVMRYQGDQMAQIEGELRWQFWKRFSLVAFAGTGGTWTDASDRTWSREVWAGGGGFRYELARAYGIHIGADFAYGPDGSAFYIQFGSAWARP